MMMMTEYIKRNLYTLNLVIVLNYIQVTQEQCNCFINMNERKVSSIVTRLNRGLHYANPSRLIVGAEPFIALLTSSVEPRCWLPS